MSDIGRKKDKLIIFLSYFCAAIIFAIPLYLIFTRVQIDNNQLNGNAFIPQWADFLSFPVKLGDIIGYFYHFSIQNNIVFLIISIVLLCILIRFTFAKSILREVRMLSILTLVTYVTHYFLVKFHIYAMVHPNESMGFLCRYSYFYIPLLAVVLPVVFTEISRTYPKIVDKYKLKYVCLIFLFIPIKSCFDLKDNWRKSNNDIIADMWWTKQAYHQPTFLLGAANGAYNYYILVQKGYKSSIEQQLLSYNKQNLPSHFWIWHVGYANDEKKSLILDAKSQGYQISTFIDTGYEGSLFYCIKKETDTGI